MNTQSTIKTALKNYGLSSEQITVYLYLLKYGESTALSISKEVKIPRTNTYRILDELKDLQIVSIFKRNNISNYIAENPKRLLNILKDKENTLLEAIPFINEIMRDDKHKPNTRLYIGKNGPKIGLDILYDYLEKNLIKDIYTYSDSDIAKKIPKYLNRMIERREKLKITTNMILPFGDKYHVLKQYIPNTYRKVKYLPYGFDFKGTMIIGGNMALIMSFEEKELHTVIIDSKSAVLMFKQFFNYMWGSC